MAKGPYSKLYHVLMDEYPDIWASDRKLATFVRLLMIADKWWPQPAPWHNRGAIVTFRQLVEAGLVLECPGNRFTILGLDNERGGRSEHGKRAASIRWSNATRNAEPMPSKVEQSRVSAQSTNGAPQAFMGWKPRVAVDKEAERRAIERMQRETDEELYRRHPELRPRPSPGTS